MKPGIGRSGFSQHRSDGKLLDYDGRFEDQFGLRHFLGEGNGRRSFAGNVLGGGIGLFSSEALAFETLDASPALASAGAGDVVVSGYCSTIESYFGLTDAVMTCFNHFNEAG